MLTKIYCFCIRGYLIPTNLMTIESKTNIFCKTVLSLNFFLTNLPIVKRGFFSTSADLSHLSFETTSYVNKTNTYFPAA